MAGPAGRVDAVLVCGGKWHDFDFARHQLLGALGGWEQVRTRVFEDYRRVDALERADREDSDVAEARTARLKEKIAALKRQMQSLKEMGKQVEAAPDKEGQRGTSRGP